MLRGYFLKFIAAVLSASLKFLSILKIYRARYRRDLMLFLRYFYAIEFPVYNKFRIHEKNPPLSIYGYSKNNLRVVSEILKENNIEFYWLPVTKYSQSRSRFAVNAKDAEKFFHCISRLPKQTAPLYCRHRTALMKFSWNAKKTPFLKIQKKNPQIIMWSFFLGYGSNAMDSFSKRAACQVEFFVTKGKYHQLLMVNDVSRLIKIDEPKVTIEEYSIILPTWQLIRDSKILGCNEYDVDLVYTWVDGRDQAWLSEKRKYQDKAGECHVDAIDEGRFISRDELKYSLRSVAYYANFFRHIYIVTNGQIPVWLNVDHEKIIVIKHDEIFRLPDQSLPTFNSHTIESVLHRIPGLTERFVYMNDDMLFCKTICKTHLFSQMGYPYVFLNNKNNFGFVEPSADTSPYVNAGRNTMQIIYRKFGKVFSSTVRHSPYCHLKSNILEIENELQNDLIITESHKFRHVDDISLPASLALIWGLACGRVVEGTLESTTITLSDKWRMSFALIKLLVFKDKQFLCINESKQYKAEVQRRIDFEIASFLESYYPLKCEFENANNN
jgi:hypothetical protein